MSRRVAVALGTVALGAFVMAVFLPTGITASPIEPAPVPRPRTPRSPLGLRVVALEAAEARVLGLTGAMRVVHAIGQAYESGLRVDDLIVAVNGQPVTGFEAFWDAVAAADWKPTLRVLREAKPLTIRLGAQPSRLSAINRIDVLRSSLNALQRPSK